MEIIYKGEDKRLSLTVCDNDSNPIDLNNVVGILVSIYQDGIELDKYSNPTKAGFSEIQITDAVNGEIEINLQSAQTILGKVNKSIFLAIKIQTVQASFDNGIFDSIEEDIKIGVLKNAVTKSFN